VISITENSAQLIRPSPVVFPQGQASLPLVEATMARLLNLADGQVVQGTVQTQGDQLALLLRGRLLELPPGVDWSVGQRLNLRAQTNADGTLTLNRLPTPSQGKSAPGPGTAAGTGSTQGASAYAGGAAAPVGSGIDPALAAHRQFNPPPAPSSVPAGTLYPPPPVAVPDAPSGTARSSGVVDAAPTAAATPADSPSAAAGGVEAAPTPGRPAAAAPTGGPVASPAAAPGLEGRSLYAGADAGTQAAVDAPLRPPALGAAMAQLVQVQPANAGAVAQQQLMAPLPPRAGAAPRTGSAPATPWMDSDEAEPGSSAYAPPLVALPPLHGRVAPLAAPTVARVDAPTVQAMGLKDGQVLQASVQARDGALGFVVEGRVLPTLEPGTGADPLLVNLRVQIDADGSATLHNLLAPTPKPAPAAAPLSLAPVSLGGVLATVAEEVPQRVVLGPQDFFSRLGSLLFRASGLPEMVNLFNSGTLDAALGRIGRPDLQAQWARQRLSMGQLSPRDVRGAVQAALGSERDLLSGVERELPANDTKQLLLGVLASMGSPDELSGDDLRTAQHLQRGVDDLESAQVRAAQAQAQQDVLFHMVIPFKDAAPVEIQFERRRTSEGKSSPFTVNVHSTSVDYGELWLKTELLGPSQVDLVMWARRSEVVALAQSAAGDLGAQLQASGLAMRSFQVIHGERPGSAPEAAQEPPLSALAGAVLDIRA